MKKITLLNLITLLFLSNLISQVPNLMSYQAVIWDASGNLVSEKMVSIKISILQGSVTGANVYSETHKVQTNINGLVSLMIGIPLTKNIFSGRKSLFRFMAKK